MNTETTSVPSVRSLRNELQGKVLEALQAFEQASGMRVTGIDVVRINVGGAYSTQPEDLLHGVIIGVGL